MFHFPELTNTIYLPLYFPRVWGESDINFCEFNPGNHSFKCVMTGKKKCILHVRLCRLKDQVVQTNSVNTGTRYNNPSISTKAVKLKSRPFKYLLRNPIQQRLTLRSLCLNCVLSVSDINNISDISFQRERRQEESRLNLLSISLISLLSIKLCWEDILTRLESQQQ